MRRWLLFMCQLIVVTVASAQKEQKVTASYIYYAPENITLEEAKRTALERAKLTAIADAFGTLVTQSNSTVITNENGMTDSRFFSLGGSEVKGEWVETTKGPNYNVRYESGMLIVSVDVCGVIKEITNSRVDIRTKILRNGTDEKYESTYFRNGDDLFLYFKSPIDGYLLAYIFDETTNQVVRILPYIKSTLASIPIKGDKEYVFFKKERNTDYMVDEYIMTANQPIEFNTLYVVFSPTNITKAIDKPDDSQEGIRSLKYDDFNKWLVGIKKQSNATIIEHTIIVKQ